MYSAKAPRGASWGIIVFLLFLFFPLGIGVMISKLHKEKDRYMENGKAVARVGWIGIFLGILYLLFWNLGDLQTTDGEPVLFDMIVFMFLFLSIGGFLLIIYGRKYKQRGLDYLRYSAIIANVYSDSLDDIAAAYPKPYEQVCKDLQGLFKDGFFAGCSLDLAQRRLVSPGKRRSDRPKTTVNRKEYATESKPKVVKCPNCSATNAVEGMIGECEYCGSPLT